MSQRSQKDSWNNYYKAKKQSEVPNALLQKALALIGPGKGRTALDLGCGTGADTCLLLKRGFIVHAIDAQAKAIKMVRASVPVSVRNRITTQVQTFETLRLKDLPAVELINASFSLFFCSPSSFQKLWSRLIRRLEPGGIFCGHFLGMRDSWAGKRGITAVSKKS